MIFEVAGLYINKKQYRKEIFELQDGGEMSINWLLSEKLNNPQAPILILLPGLSGDQTSFYSKSMAQAAEDQGFQYVVINYRGMDNVSLKTPKINDAGDTSDIKEAIDYIYAEHCLPHGRQIFGVGISLGAAILANYVAGEGKNCPLNSAVSVGCHFESNKCFEFMKQNLFGFYDYTLGTGLLYALLPNFE